MGHRSVLVLGLMMLSAALAGTLAAAALGSFPGRNGVIAYSAEGSIWAVDPATGNQLRLAAGTDPSFSASGNMLAFQRRAAGTNWVYLARADGSEARSLVEGSEPAFSPSGQRIVFVRAGGLFLTGITPGSPIRQITFHPGDREPKWSSTGLIVFERTDVWQVRYRGRIEHAIRSVLAVIRPPSRHAHEILTNGPVRETEELCTDPSCEHEATGLVYGRGADMWPDWSPDGKTLIVSGLFGCLLVPRPPGTRLINSSRLKFRFNCSPSAWAPEGERLAESGALRGSDFVSCPQAPEYNGEISWQPLVPGTIGVPTVPCAGEKRVVVPSTGTSPSKEEARGPNPHKSHRRRNRHR